MKKLIVFIGFLLLTLHTNYAAKSIHDATSTLDFSVSTIVENEHNNQKTLENTIFFTSISEFESVIQNTTQISSSTFKNNSKHFFYLVKLTEEIFASSFAQYTSTSGNFTIKYTTAKIIFPFHYHW